MAATLSQLHWKTQQPRLRAQRTAQKAGQQWRHAGKSAGLQRKQQRRPRHLQQPRLQCHARRLRRRSERDSGGAAAALLVLLKRLGERRELRQTWQKLPLPLSSNQRTQRLLQLE